MSIDGNLKFGCRKWKHLKKSEAVFGIYIYPKKSKKSHNNVAKKHRWMDEHTIPVLLQHLQQRHTCSGNRVLIHPMVSGCFGATCLQLETMTSCPSSTSSSIFSTNPFLRQEICTKPSRVAPMSTKTPYLVISTTVPL